MFDMKSVINQGALQLGYGGRCIDGEHEAVNEIVHKAKALELSSELTFDARSEYVVPGRQGEFEFFDEGHDNILAVCSSFI